MKKTILIITILFFSNNVKSQITKGYWMVGGDGNFFYSKSKDDFREFDSAWVLRVSPNIGYFIKDQLAMGIGTSLNFGKTWNGWGLELRPFTRYYFLNSDKNLNYFTEVSYTYFNYFYKEAADRKPQFSYSFKPGVAYFLNDVVALEFSVTYSYLKTPKNNNRISNHINIGIGLQIHLEKNNKN